ncbi:UNVERIFIED_CONTAM: U-box domain-containing protein 45 [Sesamum radiatum]|uniref:U-box domain-containing protein 45 n=1 Tax=Sesamum radiatum TaxID=300843 RepID=A0AAW2RZ25_SESRA
MAPGLISALATILDVGEPVEQEQAAACLLILCNSNEACSQMVLQEGVIPSLVSISVNGTVRGKQKAQKLLMLFREQRQRDPSPVPTRPGLTMRCPCLLKTQASIQVGLEKKSREGV